MKFSSGIKKLLPFVILLLLCGQVSAQRRNKGKKKEPPVQVVDEVPPYNIVISRKLFHENIDNEQKLLLNSDGKDDKKFKISDDAKLNEIVTDAAIKGIDWLQYQIETDSTMDHRHKVAYLSGTIDILKYVRQNWRSHEVDASYLPQIIATYKRAIALDKANESVVPVIRYLNYDVAHTALLPGVFDNNRGYKEVKDLLLLKLSRAYPKKTFAALKAYPDAPFADSLIKVTAHKYPQQLYDYAQANNKLSYRMQNITDDSLVTIVVAMARSATKSGQYYFPFLDNIVSHKTSIKEIDAAKDDPVKYFKLLVKTQMGYVERAMNGDTAIGFKDLTKRLTKKAEDEFVAKINGLHESPDAIRFRSIQLLSAEELYYVAVLTDGLIYTSSYTKGVYPLMMKKVDNKGDELLKHLHFDRYRKFLSQAAAYNTLKGFLASFSHPDDAGSLMTSFVSGLERSQELEDGVDVADSYASIYETLPQLAGQMLGHVKENYERNLDNHNKKGIAIYNILYKLFLSADSTNNIDLTKELGIPPVYSVPFSSLQNAKGEVVAQVFFYGDKDGKGIYNGFVNMFGNSWSIDASNKQWVLIKSKSGANVSIYANKPLPEETGEDDKAQQALVSYLEENEMQPSVTIHRGHSYYANSTIEYMAPSSKIVFMGSCGGFNLIDNILQKCTDAHIIASKQIGKTSVNKPFFLLLTEKLRTGKDIDWISFWKEFKSRANVAGFEDYIPPYKNLGAIFIKAYKKETGEADL
jgi:hypothetical protein